MHALILRPASSSVKSIRKTLASEGFSFKWVDHLDTTRMSQDDQNILKTCWKPIPWVNEAALLRYFREIADPEQMVYVFVEADLNFSRIDGLEVMAVESEVFELRIPVG